MNQYIANEKQTILKINNQLNQSDYEVRSNAFSDSIMSFNDKTNLYLTQLKDAERLISAIHQEYKGKTIIIDHWTTWCGVCYSDMNNSVEAKKELQDNGVEMFYFGHENGNTTKDRWQNKIAEHSIEGHHIFLPKALSKSVMNTYRVRGFPTYQVIDQSGDLQSDWISFMGNLDVDAFLTRI